MAITFNNKIWKYEDGNGNSYDTLEAAQQAVAQTQQSGPTLSNAPIQDSAGNLVQRNGEGTYVPVNTPSIQGLTSATRTSSGSTVNNGGGYNNQQSSYELERQRAIDQQNADREFNLQQQRLQQSDPAMLAKIQADAEARRTAALPQITAAAAGGSNAPVSYGNATADSARAAAYARAKDQIANQQRASLTALHDVASERGVNVAGGQNAALTGAETNLINQGQGQLGEVTREQQVQDLQNTQHVNDTVFSGNIQQRAQNLNTIPSLAGLVTARALY